MSAEQRHKRKTISSRSGGSIRTLFLKVTKIHDGDTVKGMDSEGIVHTIRLANIDAPELGQQLGIESRNHLQSLIPEGENIVVKTKPETDRWHRTIGTIFKASNNLNVNKNMVAMGYAYVYRDYFDGDQEYIVNEDNAKHYELGVWGGSQDRVPPREYRKSRRLHKKPTL